MPKMKTHSGARKRFKKLKGGLIKFTKAGRRHLLTKKSASRKRNLRRSAYVNKANYSAICSMLPN
jgi:large subunit ribosomal protein L35